MMKRLLNKTGHSLKRFRRDERGNYMLTTALLTPVLLAVVGGAIDTAEMHRARTDFQNALDAGALIAAKTFTKGGTDTEAFDAGRRAFEANLGNLRNSSANFQLVGTAADCKATGLVAQATLRHPLIFDGVRRAFVSQEDPGYANIQGSTTVSCGDETVEVAMVLDNSGSMRWNGKLSTLRSASTQLVNSLHNTLGGSLKPDPIKFSLVPFASMVNVGSSNRNASWMDTRGQSPIHHENLNWADNSIAVPVGNGYQDGSGNWLTRFTLYNAMRVNWAGCVEARPYPYNVQDDDVSQSVPATLTVPSFAPDTPDNWSGDRERNTVVVTSSQPYCIRWNRRRRCRLWNDGWRRRVHFTGATANFFSSEYGGRGVWQGGSSGSTQVVDGDYISERSYLNNYINDAHNFGQSKYTLDPRDRSFTGTGADQYKRQKWSWKYFNNPSIRNVTAGGWNGGPNAYCTTRTLTDLTTSKSRITNAINNMIADGSTNVPQGVVWGWRTLTEKPPFTNGRPKSVADNKKIMIIMTDGNNTYYPVSSFCSNCAQDNKSTMGAYGLQVHNRIFDGFTAISNPSHNAATYTQAMDEKLATVCQNVKNDGIRIYSIAFDVPNGSSVKRTLEGCASEGPGGGKLYYDASDNAALVRAFDDIAEKIAELRISR